MTPYHARRPKFHGEKYLKFRCTECGNCCSDTIVPVTDEDVRRIMQGTGRKVSEVAKFYKSSDFDDAGEGLQFVNLDGGRRTLGLLKRMDKENDREACEFFRDNRCSVYKDRPVTCRVWPFTLRFDASGKRLSSLSVNSSLPCPFELDGKNTVSALVADWRWDDKQDEAWSAKVKEWNRTHSAGAEHEFFSYLGLA
ncbi:MAG TPA: YkgJ family cysteine cluster protein [bacterium]|jgi:Fe-S-cluster containining protein|nr:YkgJ family cysteine cluster protein [bacterium]